MPGLPRQRASKAAQFEEAFAALVLRHVNLVYFHGAAAGARPASGRGNHGRRCSSFWRARRRRFGPKTILSGWLCRAARYAGANALTIQRRGNTGTGGRKCNPF